MRALRRLFPVLPALAVSACAYAPLATSPDFNVVVADEASRLAAASSPEKRLSVLLDILDERVRQIHELRETREIAFTWEVGRSYRRLLNDALLPVLAEAPSMVPAARERLREHEKQLARAPEVPAALAACRDALRSMDRS